MLSFHRFHSFLFRSIHSLSIPFLSFARCLAQAFVANVIRLRNGASSQVRRRLLECIKSELASTCQCWAS